MRISIVVISPPGYQHAAAFAEVAETLYHGLRELGHQVTTRVNGFDMHALNIVLGPQLLSFSGLTPAPDSILYNLEQISLSSTWMRPAMLEVFKGRVIWDYDAHNALRFRDFNLEVDAIVPLGYAPQMTRIPHGADRDIDVLFFGSLNPRRRRILNDMRALGLRVEALFGSYGEHRDALIARAKIVLNVHFYEAKILEMVRISYLLANGCTVLSERSMDKAQDDELAGGVEFADYNGLARRAVELVRDQAVREAIGARGLEIMRAQPIVNFLRPALERHARAA